MKYQDYLLMNNEIKNKIVPELRFPEFKDASEWEEKILNKLGKLINGLTYSPDDVRKNGLLVLRSSNVKNGQIVLDDNVYVRQDIKGANYSQQNDILICVRNGSKALIGKNAIIPRGMPICTHGAFMTVFRSNISDFVFQLFQTDAYNRQVAGDLGATINSINGSNFLKYKFCIPTNTIEQKKIADCLSSLDELITAESQKLDALKAHKKGLMQQLFPSEGETVPKLRFEEFRESGEWVEKTLGQIAELTSSKRVHLSDYVTNGIPFFRGKEISILKNQELLEDILYISEEQYEEIREKYGVPEIGDILITSVGTLANVYCVRNSDKFYFKDGNLIWMKNISEDSNFLEILLDVKRNEILASAIGSSQKALTMVALNKLEFKFPKKVEQQKIAHCLSSLNELITAQVEKIESLKKHKKGLMQGLFPNINDIS